MIFGTEISYFQETKFLYPLSSLQEKIERISILRITILIHYQVYMEKSKEFQYLELLF